MKCPRCGHWNQPSFPRCFKCGAPLEEKNESAPSWREQFEKPHKEKIRVLYDDADAQPTVEEFVSAGTQPKEQESLSEEMTRLKNRRARGEKYLEAMREETLRQEEQPAASGVRVLRAQQQPEAAPADPPAPETRDRFQAGRLGAEGRYASEEPDDDFAPLDEDPDEPYDDPYAEMYADSLPPTGPAVGMAHRRARKRRRMRKPFAVAVWLVRILVVLAVAFGGWQLWTVIHGYVEEKSVSAESVNALIETCEIDGQPGHRVTILADEGTQCYISELTKSYVAVNGVITLNLADHVFYDGIDNLEADSMTVTLTPTMIFGGKETRKAPITYEIEIPASPLTLVSPETTWLEVTTSVYNITLQVAPGSKVIANSTDISDTVSEDGVVDYNPVVQAIGDNIISFTVRAPYCRESRLVVTLYREPMSIPIELSADTIARTDSDIVVLTATTKAGATITVETPYESIDDSELATTGKFTVRAKLTKIGYNDVIIHADYPGLEQSTLTHRVYYQMPANKYTTKAWALKASDYSELMSNINMRIDNAQIYECKGTITQIISTNPQIAIMDTGTNGSEQLVMLQNETSTTWTLGEKYRVFADVTGVYGTMPKMMARYTYAYQ